MSRWLFSIGISIVLLLSIVTDWYAELSIVLVLMILAVVLNKIGKGIVLLEVTSLFYVFTCLIMPLVGYHYYTYDNHLARLWVKYMPVSEASYFSFSLPAVTTFCLGITLPYFQKYQPDSGSVVQRSIAIIKGKLQKSGNLGLRIMVIGVAVSIVTKFLPASLNYFAILIFFGSFAGLLYVYFSPSFKYKKSVIFLFILFILANALQSGMFTIVAYMGITMFSFFQVGASTSMIKKVGVMLLGVAFLFVLQNVKALYRKNTWQDSYQGNRVELFSTLFATNVGKGSLLLSQDALFPIYIRTNQGYNVGMVIRRIPASQPFDNGRRLSTVLASAFVPRFLWADKPEAGGKFNMQYYAGMTIKGWSVNVGTLGEAYGSFGIVGGIFYMLLIGLFLRWVYFRVFYLSAKIPLLICWLPVLFYDTTSSAETDTLQIINSIVKSAFFIWMLIKVLPGWFGIDRLKRTRRRLPAERVAPLNDLSAG